MPTVGCVQEPVQRMGRHPGQLAHYFYCREFCVGKLAATSYTAPRQEFSRPSVSYDAGYVLMGIITLLPPSRHRMLC